MISLSMDKNRYVKPVLTSVLLDRESAVISACMVGGGYMTTTPSTLCYDTTTLETLPIYCLISAKVTAGPMNDITGGTPAAIPS